jgi:hypothetical protein
MCFKKIKILAQNPNVAFNFTEKRQFVEKLIETLYFFAVKHILFIRYT